ncbi:hypothetical protein [Filomicrobium sp.]|uniref:hypothetical protein n=1 Tax=Filomicrobium sp. TaxID=2024831 RepID=UPI0025909D2F|nr:hypothetical protein [Filomicrobium sp.]MCV0368769.1 hypothetical protein [Filomicrobium sp.]
MRSVGRIRALLTALSVFAAAASAGCSPGDVQFEGKIFDAMGMNAPTTRTTPKMESRSPLVVPPDLARLPDPNAPAQTPEDISLAAINDPDRAKVVDQEMLKKQQEEYCAKHYDTAVAMGRADADSVSGPLGPCRKSVLSAMKEWNAQ